MPEITWLPVPGFEGIYEVSNDGRVRGIRRAGSKGGELTPTPNKHGYPLVSLRRPGYRRQVAIHRLVAAAFIGPCPPGLEVRHDDGNPANNHASNLAYGTHAENMRDKARHGTDHNLAKTHCPKNHRYDEVNTIRRRDGGRDCRTCRNAYHRALRARRRAERMAA